jgi:hypothetical protein
MQRHQLKELNDHRINGYFRIIESLNDEINRHTKTDYNAKVEYRVILVKLLTVLLDALQISHFLSAFNQSTFCCFYIFNYQGAFSLLMDFYITMSIKISLQTVL